MSKSFIVCLLSRVLLWRHFHAPKHDAAQNEAWLVTLPVSHMASWAGLGHSKRPKFPDLLPSVWRSGYARLATRQQTILDWYHASECRPMLHKLQSSTVAERAQRVALQLQKTHANRKSTSKSRKHHQFDSRCCKCSQRKQIKKRAANAPNITK